MAGEDDLHHLRRVLRLGPDEEIGVSDGAGRWRPCRLGGQGLIPVGETLETPRLNPLLTVGLAMPKGERLEWAVQKMVEVGVDRIQLLRTDRGVVRWDSSKAERQLRRLNSVLRAAAMQSRQVWMPELVGPCEVADLAALGASMAEPGGENLSGQETAVLIGPEGGWSERELDQGLNQVSLSAGVLRTETAAVVAATMLVALRAGSLRAQR